MPNVWSCSMFLNEVDVLEIRLAELDPVVEVFVIVEATTTHMGTPRELVFPQYQNTRFFPWAHKIRYIAIDFPPDMDRPWSKEGYQREQAGLGLTGLRPDDYVIISDVDEIVNAPTVAALKAGSFPYELPLSISLPIHPYRLDWKWDTHTDGQSRCTIIRGEHLRQCEGGFAGMQYHVMEANKKAFLVGEYGWHFTYIGDEQRIVEKTESIADEWVKGLASTEDARRAIETGVDVFGRPERKASRVPIETLPVYVQENRQRFSHILGGTYE